MASKVTSTILRRFAYGAPSSTLQTDVAKLMRAATIHRTDMDMGERAKNDYGYANPQGDHDYLHQLSKFLTENYRQEVKKENLFTTAGATNGLHLILSTLFDGGSIMFAEEPTYFYTVANIPHLGHKLVPVPSDGDGIIIEDLEKLLKQHAAERGPFVPTPRRPYSTMLYVITVFNNPRGMVYTAERCEAIVKLAKKYDVLVVSEDVYTLLNYREGTTAPKRLMAYDDMSAPDYKGTVVSNASFAKYLSPGIRVGWIEGPQSLVKSFSTSPIVVGGGNLNQYASMIVASGIELGLQQKLLEKFIKEYTIRMKRLCELLREHLPEGSDFEEPYGGYFVWINLPPIVDAMELLNKAKAEYNLDFLPGFKSSAVGRYTNCVRLSIAYVEYDLIEDGVKDFCKCVKEYMTEKSKL